MKERINKTISILKIKWKNSLLRKNLKLKREIKKLKEILEETKHLTEFYKSIVFAEKSFDINYKEVSKVLFNEVDRLNHIIDKAIENCKKSIESINQKLQDDKTIKVVDGKVANMNEYQIIRLKAIRMKCKELLAILGDKE